MKLKRTYNIIVFFVLYQFTNLVTEGALCLTIISVKRHSFQLTTVDIKY